MSTPRRSHWFLLVLLALCLLLALGIYLLVLGLTLPPFATVGGYIV